MKISAIHLAQNPELTKTERPSRGGLSRNPISGFDQAAAGAFRFLRQPSRPGAARPPTNPKNGPFVMRLTLNHDACD